MASAEFRQHLYPAGHPRIDDLRGLDALAYREVAHQEGTFTGDLVKGWTPLYRNAFSGITETGAVRDGLYVLDPAPPTERAPVPVMVRAAGLLLDALSEADRTRISYPVDAVEWQTWANPEFLQFDTGLRLESQSEEVRTRALALLEASLSPEGYRLARGMMLINGFLGEVVGLEGILNEFSYNIALYGTPHPTAPWGWQLFGHHCAVNCLVVEGRMSLSPLFFGAEPNEIDEGPRAGLSAFGEHIRRALELMAALPEDQRDSATVYREMVDPRMPPGRVHPGDERHLGGAFQDNRVIPLEGIPVAGMDAGAQRMVTALIEEFVAPLPAGPRAARMREVADHLHETWFSWIGGHEPGDVFYLRIQSPVIMVELDHHCGVFLDYDTPRRFHVHTVLRTPHGNDYGRAWVREWQRRGH